MEEWQRVGREWQVASDELASGWKKAVSSKSHPGGVVLESRWMEEWQRMMAASGELASGWKKAVLEMFRERNVC